MTASPKNFYFFVENRTDALKFWKNVLGLEEEKSNDERLYTSLWLGGCLLELEEIKAFQRDQWSAIAQALPAGINEIPRVKPGIVFRIDVEVDNLAVLRAKLTQQNIPFVNSALPAPSNIPFVRVDASGVFVRLFELPDNG